MTKNHQSSLQYFPPMWPIIALTKAHQSALFTFLSISTCLLLLIFMAHLHRHQLRRPGRDDGDIESDKQSDWLLSLPGKLFDCARPEVVALEADGAFYTRFLFTSHRRRYSTGWSMGSRLLHCTADFCWKLCQWSAFLLFLGHIAPLDSCSHDCSRKRRSRAHSFNAIAKQ